MDKIKKAQKEQLDSLVTQWGLWRERSKSVMESIESNQGEILEKETDEALLCALRSLDQTKGSGTLWDVAVSHDAEKSLAALMNRPSLMGASYKKVGELEAHKDSLGSKAVRGQAKRCLAMLCEGDAVFALRQASICLSLRDPFVAGYVTAMECAVRAAKDLRGGLSRVDVARFAGQVLSQGLMFEHAMDERSTARLATLDAAEMLMGRGDMSLFMGEALMRAACCPLPGQARAWALVKALPSTAQELELHGPKRTEVLGIKEGCIKLSHPKIDDEKHRPCVVIPPLLDMAWWAASQATSEESVTVAGEMAGFFKATEDNRPHVSASMYGLSHPLDRVWGVWNNSVCAGFALPLQPLDSARRVMRSELALWAELVGEKCVAPWRKLGESVLASLYAGKIPDTFGTFTERPKLDTAKKEASCVMSPAAYCIAIRAKNHKTSGLPCTEKEFLCLSRAGTRLGMSVSETARQLSQTLGYRIESGWLAKAERDEMMLEIQEAPRLGRKPLRM